MYKRNSVALTGAVLSVLLLGGCGVASDENNIANGEPDVGQALEADNNQVISTPPAPAIQTPTTTTDSTPTSTPSQPTLIESEPTPTPVTAEPTPAPVEPEPTPTPAEPEPTPVPIEPEPTESTPEPQPLPEEPEPASEPEPPIPVNVSCTASTEDIQRSTLNLINEARAIARSCGDTFFEAAAPLTWSSKLASAALIHSDDMALHNFFSHTGSDGSDVSQRVDTQGYNWRGVGENIAAGQATTELAIDAWLDSPGHCENLMNPMFTELAVSCVENSGSQYRVYWTNVLGTSF